MHLHPSMIQAARHPLHQQHAQPMHHQHPMRHHTSMPAAVQPAAAGSMLLLLLLRAPSQLVQMLGSGWVGASRRWGNTRGGPRLLLRH